MEIKMKFSELTKTSRLNEGYELSINTIIKNLEKIKSKYGDKIKVCIIDKNSDEIRPAIGVDLVYLPNSDRKDSSQFIYDPDNMLIKDYYDGEYGENFEKIDYKNNDLTPIALLDIL